MAPASPAAPTPAAFVRAYYAALDGRRFKAAWGLLPRAVRTAFGGFAKWRAGYASTLSSRPVDIRVHRAPGGGVTVRHTLIARDRCGGGPAERRFSVTWRLASRGGALSVASLSAIALSPAPRRPCT